MQIRDISELDYMIQFLIDENNTAVIAYHTQTLKFAFVNEMATKLYGYPQKKFLKLHYSDIAAPPNTFIKNTNKKMTKSQRNSVQFHINKDGITLPLEIIRKKVTIADNDYYVEILQDVSERFKTEQKLMESEERFRIIFEQAADSIVVVDAKNGGIIEFNELAHKSLGYTREEFAKLKIGDFEVIESHAEVVGHCNNIIKKGAETFDTKHKTKNGDIRNIIVNCRVISINNEKFIQSTWRDVTEIKKTQAQLKMAHDTLEKKVKVRTAELEKTNIKLQKEIYNHFLTGNALQESERAHQTLLSNLPGIAYRGKPDKQRTMEYVSEGSVDLIGYKPSDITEHRWTYSDMIHPDDYTDVQKNINDAIAAGLSFKQVYRIKTKFGLEKWVLEHGVGITLNANEVIYIEGFITDVTAQKRHENKIKKENLHLRSSVKGTAHFCGLLGKSKAILEVYDTLLNASLTDANIIIYGESGTGKELAAKAVHDLSERCKNKFITVNCGAIPHELFESEFFGYKKGAFTGAVFDKIGYIESAENGTLFLDEIAEISPAMQVKLLRAIDGGGYTALGDSKIKHPDIRIVAATNKDLNALVRQGDVREDFFYRIHVVPVYMPPLRFRSEDIPLLAMHFLQEMPSNNIATIPLAILDEMLQYEWPGNVRELKNVIQRLSATNGNSFESYLPGLVNQIKEPVCNTAIQETTLRKAVECFEAKYIQSVLEKNYWHQINTSKILDIDRKTLARKIKRHGLR